MPRQKAFVQQILLGLLAGLVGGITFAALVPSPFGFWGSLILNIVLGGVFGFVVAAKIDTAGAGLIWGQAYGLFLWLVSSLLLTPLVLGQGLDWTITAVQETVPQLLGQVAGYGAVMGLTYYFLITRLPKLVPLGNASSVNPTPQIPVGQAIVPPRIRATLVGGLGGLLGSWIFIWGIETARFYPLVAGLIRSESIVVGQLLHYVIGIVIGVSFGLLFSRDALGAGPSLVWGMNYGLLWWIIGPLTLVPLINASAPNWSLVSVQTTFSSIVAHLLYGAIMGLCYALVNKLWQILFVDSDPLNRAKEGIGTRGFRNVWMGQAGGILGGLLYTIVLANIGALPSIAGLTGATSEFAGFVVHMIISIIIGSSYGLFFQREAYSFGSGLAWGSVYGLLWWFIGSLTLYPILVGLPVNWSGDFAVRMYPFLIGHLIYGASLGLQFHYLTWRYDTGLRLQNQPDTQTSLAAKQVTAAPALWVVTLILGVMLPLLLAGSDNLPGAY